jgi:hypothetical protein
MWIPLRAALACLMSFAVKRADAKRHEDFFFALLEEQSKITAESEWATVRGTSAGQCELLRRFAGQTSDQP